MPDKKELRIKLDRNAFEALVHGSEVLLTEKGTEVRIILADIGFMEMLRCIEKATRARD